MRDTRRTRLALAGLLIAALALMGLSYQGRSSSLIGAMRGAAGWAAGGAERAVFAVTRPVAGFFGSGLSRGRSSAEVAALQRQLVRLRAQLSAAQLSRADYRQLRRLLGTAAAGGYRVVSASAIAFGQGYQQTVTLNAGTADGVRTQQTVLDASGLVGQVIAVTSGSCTVLLASDPRSVVGIRLAPGGQIGWVTGSGGAGSGPGLLSLQVLGTAAALRPGEQLVTAASVNDRPFVPGVPVGVIVSVQHRAGSLTRSALVRPYASFTSLNVVGIVIAPPLRNPRFALLRGHRLATLAGTARPGTGSARGGPPRARSGH